MGSVNTSLMVTTDRDREGQGERPADLLRWPRIPLLDVAQSYDGWIALLAAWLTLTADRATEKTRSAYASATFGQPDLTRWVIASRCANSFHFRRAAALFALRTMIANALQHEDIIELNELSCRVDRLQETAWTSLSRSAPPKRKKNRLSSYPRDWVAKLFDAAASDDARFLLLALELTGCRPAEFELGDGVALSLVGTTPTTVALRCMIRGAKIDKRKQSGQEWRILIVEADFSARLEWLTEKLRGAQGSTVGIHARARQVTQRVADLSRRTWPARSAANRPSAYSFRHLIASSIKEAGRRASAMGAAPLNGVASAQPGTDGSGILLASTLGHQSTRTGTHYGRSGRSGNSAVRILAAEATAQPRAAGLHTATITVATPSLPRARGHDVPAAEPASPSV